jgi:hypothetical protein
MTLVAAGASGFFTFTHSGARTDTADPAIGDDALKPELAGVQVVSIAALGWERKPSRPNSAS